jgi:hypothetical protein
VLGCGDGGIRRLNTRYRSQAPPDSPLPKASVTPRKKRGGSLTLVEVAGIEPASFVALMGLLRAQCAVSLLGLTSHAHKLV